MLRGFAMSKKERVVCAAVKVYITNDNYSEPVVVAGIDYQSINNSGLVSAVAHPTYCNMNRLGFVTNKNRFVDPAEALRIALDSRQLGKEVVERMIHECAITLKPEDLY